MFLKLTKLKHKEIITTKSLITIIIMLKSEGLIESEGQIY